MSVESISVIPNIAMETKAAIERDIAIKDGQISELEAALARLSDLLARRKEERNELLESLFAVRLMMHSNLSSAESQPMEKNSRARSMSVHSASFKNAYQVDI